MPAVLPTMYAGLFGTSLTSPGRLSAGWPSLHLLNDVLALPECVGPVQICNEASGSKDSAWMRDNAFLLGNKRCTHVLTEGGSINDAAVSGGVPAVSLTDHNANVTAMVGTWRAARADVAVTIQTMSPVSQGGNALRPNLSDYYAADIALAATLNLGLIDNYGGTIFVPGGWNKPMPAVGYTDQDDGLHPVWPGVIENYLYPNVLAWFRTQMAAFWGLAAPVFSPAPALMTGPTAPAGNAAVASNEASGFEAWKAFDGSRTARWVSTAYPVTLRRSWTTPKNWGYYSLDCGTTPGANDLPTAWTLWGSNDGGASFTLLDTRTGQPAPNGAIQIHYKIADPGPYLMYEMRPTSTQFGNPPSIAEWAFGANPLG